MTANFALTKVIQPIATRRLIFLLAQTKRRKNLPEKEIIEEEFDCHQANEIVTITREVLIHRTELVNENETPP